MSRESYFALALGVAAIIGVVLQMMYPVIPLCVGWVIISILAVGAISLVVRGIIKGKKRESKPPVISDGQKIEVKPDIGRRDADYERTEHLMWAELQVTNIGTQELNNVQVHVVKFLNVIEVEGKYKLWNQLNLKPFAIYWSERDAQPKQMSLDIPSGAIRSALVAFQDNSNGGNYNFNTRYYHWIVIEGKVDVEISSSKSVVWRGEFYIQCHPNYWGGDRAKFEFREWNEWVAMRNISPLEPDKEGFLNE
ncbi:hypothetical protein ACFLV4_05605 [Chloroflexota bacterium]